MVFSLSMIHSLLNILSNIFCTQQCINQIKPNPFLNLKWLFSRKAEVHKAALSSELRKKPANINLKKYWFFLLCSFIELLEDMVVIKQFFKNYNTNENNLNRKIVNSNQYKLI